MLYRKYTLICLLFDIFNICEMLIYIYSRFIVTIVLEFIYQFANIEANLILRIADVYIINELSNVKKIY